MSYALGPSQTIGDYIKREIIPAGMSVTAAAKRLRIGRPALSNLLNGKASLSREMAVRLEKTFGANAHDLLKLQAGAETAAEETTKKQVAVRAYVPSFLSIKAKEIHDWPKNNLDARSLLPVLLRRLIHSTGHSLRQVDFPGYDNAQRKGWDGWIEADAATAWIPAGTSGWEFGTGQEPRDKAEKDYNTRTASIPAAERANYTFVFVTPRNWPGKAAWARGKNQSNEWKSVRALDASDLEQWLEESVPAQMWLAEKLGRPINGFQTIEYYWDSWKASTKPEMTPAIFAPSIIAYQRDFKKWLDEPPDRVFVVAADSRDEALAFLSRLFLEPSIAAMAGDLAVVFDSAQALRNLASSSSPFIPIVTTPEAERELASFLPRFHCIAVRPRNAVDSEPDIALDLLRHEEFEKALAAMGLTGDEIERLERDSGCSPTILRRQLSLIDAIKTPEWARDTKKARSLIPMMLVGAWHTKSAADCEVLSALAGRKYEEIEDSIVELLQQDDCPVWSVVQYRGVVSKIDALFALSKWITEAELERFFKVAADVLSESDPALDLPEEQRWAAGLYGKVRNHSAALREGICETLVILSVHGDNLFQKRLGFNAAARVCQLIRKLLSPLSLDKLLSQEGDLPRYAEAAPDEFLNLLETDLKKPEPIVLGLLKPARGGVFGRCQRTGLLWALECLAWNPQRLVRISAVLAQLSKTPIDDNWANKPIGSLHAIYRSWMPQTAASVEERMKALETLVRRSPDSVSWQLCVQELDLRSQVGHNSYRPRWRNDASGAGQPLTSRQEIYQFLRKALDLALGWPKHDEKTLGDLVERIGGLADTDQEAVWDLIGKWSDSTDSDKAKADLRERIRRFALTRRALRRGLKPLITERARSAYEKLTPSDPVIRHGWLFAKDWVDESADELAEDHPDFEKRDQRVHRLRQESFREIWNARGFDGVAALLSNSQAPHTIGRYASLTMVTTQQSGDFIRRCLAIAVDMSWAIDLCIGGFLRSIDESALAPLITDIVKDCSDGDIVRIFRCAPFKQETWRLLDLHAEEIRKRYWREVVPSWGPHTDTELIEIIENLLEAKRPRAAFNAVHMDFGRIETSRLSRLLQELPGKSDEPEGTNSLDGYYIGQALTALEGRSGVTPQEMANLEFMYLRALDHTDRGIPNLERQISESPAFFAQSVALTYKRSDEGEDPAEWRIEDPERRAAVASATYNLLERIKRTPGTNDDGTIDAAALTEWLIEARRLCAQLGRAEIGDQCIGKLLSHAPSHEDGIRPSLPICEAMETIASEDLAQGYAIGVYNARGAQWREEGGQPERALAAMYRGWARQRATEFPFVGGVLETIAASYDRDAEWHDSDSQVRKRLRH